MDAEVVGHMDDQNGRRRALDKWFPTIVRYVGVGLLIYAALIDQGENPALLPTAAGLILFKTIYGSANGGPRDGSK